MTAIKKQYGKDWAHVYYGLANKRAGKGLKGKHRGHVAANQAFAKGSHWTVRTRGKANISRRRRGHSVRIRVH